ncbi:MAG: SGNH/GDSL hydrolase family protein [Gracilimonas sp.]
MKRLKQLSKLLLITAVVFAGCEGAEDSLVDDRLENNPLPSEPDYTAGTADFSNYIAIGNSLTAGLMDGALYTNGQIHAFPAILADQLELVGGGDFLQPNVNSENGFNASLSNPQQGLILGRTELDASIPGPVPTEGEFPIPAFDGDRAEVNNLGVPGIRVADLFSSDLQNNNALGLYYSRFASDPGSSTIIQDAVAKSPTFFSLWIGNNDVLGYALSGGLDENMITGQSDFQDDLGNAIGALVQTGASGVVLNIPPLVTLPFFRAISYDRIELDQTTADQINAGLDPVNQAMLGLTQPPINHDPDDIARRLMEYSAGNNPILVIDEELEDLGPKYDMLLAGGAINQQQREGLVPYEQSRPLTAGELVLLTTGSVLGTEADGDDTVADTPIGVVVPLGFDVTDQSLNGDQYYLTMEEQTNIVTARATFNAVISGVIDATNQQAGAEVVHLVDVNPFMADILGLSSSQAQQLALTPAGQAAADGVTGTRIRGFDLQPDFSPAGIFSTDAVHPNPRGHAIVANEIIKKLNEVYDANIPEADILDYPAVILAQ